MSALLKVTSDGKLISNYGRELPSVLCITCKWKLLEKVLFNKKIASEYYCRVCYDIN